MVGPIPLSDICGIARLIYWSRERTFPDPDDTRHYVLGPICWERLVCDLTSLKAILTKELSTVYDPRCGTVGRPCHNRR